MSFRGKKEVHYYWPIIYIPTQSISTQDKPSLETFRFESWNFHDFSKYSEVLTIERSQIVVILYQATLENPYLLRFSRL